VLTLVRHGETRANLDGVWHGSTDTPLTERGHRQAERVARLLSQRHADAVAVYTSPLQRARDTAAAIARALGRELSLDPALGEYDLGRWEGRTFRELYDVERFWDRIREDPDFAPHGGESPRGVAERLAGGLRRIAAAHPASRVVVVTHGGALSMALGLLTEGSYHRWTRVMENCAVSELVVEPTPQLLSFNLVDHLDGV
jgi:2,3-bisphosphoglycerate-dependent phosphoglycerate mutase